MTVGRVAVQKSGIIREYVIGARLDVFEREDKVHSARRDATYFEVPAGIGSSCEIPAQSRTAAGPWNKHNLCAGDRPESPIDDNTRREDIAPSQSNLDPSWRGCIDTNRGIHGVRSSISQ